MCSESVRGNCAMVYLGPPQMSWFLSFTKIPNIVEHYHPSWIRTVVRSYHSLTTFTIIYITFASAVIPSSFLHWQDGEGPPR